MYRRVFVKGPDEFDLRYSSSRRRAADGADALAKDDEVVQTFAANGPNQSFGKTVLPRRARRDRFIPECPLRGGAASRRNRSRCLPRGSGPLALTPKEYASVIWRAIQSAVGLFVTATQTSSRRSSRTMMKL